MADDVDDTPPPDDLYKLFLDAVPELQAYTPPRKVHRVVTNRRVVDLTATLLESWAPMVHLLEEKLSVAEAKQRSDELARLDQRAWVYFAAELEAEEPNSDLSAAEAAKLALEVIENDRFLFGWATPLFGKDPGHAATLRDISRGTGRWDDAVDVQRLVNLFRSNWDQVEANPWVTKEYLATAAANAGKQLDYLRSRKKNKARKLANAAYVMWYLDYEQLMALGRYWTRLEGDSRVRFPGVREPVTRGGVVEPEVEPVIEPEQPDGGA